MTGRQFPILGIVLVILLACAVAGCTSTSGISTRKPVSSRCVAAPVMQSALQSGVTAGGVTVGPAQAVMSTDFKKIWFVAARLSGPGMAGGDVGIWATNDLEGTGAIYAIDGFAHQFTDWPDGTKTDAHLSAFDDGAQDAKACA